MQGKLQIMVASNLKLQKLRIRGRHLANGKLG